MDVTAPTRGLTPPSGGVGLLVVQLVVLVFLPFVLVGELRRAKAAGEYEPPDVRGAFRSETVRSDLLRVFRRQRR